MDFNDDRFVDTPVMALRTSVARASDDTLAGE
jgi:hypothetical protein